MTIWTAIVIAAITCTLATIGAYQGMINNHWGTAYSLCAAGMALSFGSLALAA